MLRYLLSFAIATSAFAQKGDDEPKSPSPSAKKGDTEQEAKGQSDEKKGEKPKDGKPEEKNKDGKPEGKAKETKGSVKIAGAEVPYVAKTGTLPLIKDDGGSRADVFYVYYAVTDAEGKLLESKDEGRPRKYRFNGGRGSAAVGLHFGGLGPKKIEPPPDGRMFEMLGKIGDNPQSVLDVADLVFLDPVGTGGSRPAKGEKGEQFWGVEEDIEACGEF